MAAVIGYVFLGICWLCLILACCIESRLIKVSPEKER